MFAQGDRAINSGNVADLKAAVRQLWNLLPADKKADASKAFGSGVN